MRPSHGYYRILHKQPTCTLTIGVTRAWQELGSKTACDTKNGEVYMQSSPGKGSSLEQCKQSCEDTAGCQSITFLNNGWCSHFSTSCSKTKSNNKATSYLLSSTDSGTTTALPIPDTGAEVTPGQFWLVGLGGRAYTNARWHAYTSPANI